MAVTDIVFVEGETDGFIVEVGAATNSTSLSDITSQAITRDDSYVFEIAAAQGGGTIIVQNVRKVR